MVETLVPNTQPTNDTPESTNDESGSCPFEGPEKLLEIWFAPTPEAHDTQQSTDADGSSATRSGLRTVDRKIWEDMLDIVKCKVLSVVLGREMDAYLLRSVSSSQNPSVTSFTRYPGCGKLIITREDTDMNLLQYSYLINSPCQSPP